MLAEKGNADDQNNAEDGPPNFETICVLFENTTAKVLAEIAKNVRYPLSNYAGIWNSQVGSLPLRISGSWHSIVRMAGKAVCHHHHPPALNYGFLWELKIFPAMKESYRVYLGTGSQNPNIYAY